MFGWLFVCLVYETNNINVGKQKCWWWLRLRLRWWSIRIFYVGAFFQGGAESSVEFVRLLLSVMSFYTHTHTHKHSHIRSIFYYIIFLLVLFLLCRFGWKSICWKVYVRCTSISYVHQQQFIVSIGICLFEISLYYNYYYSSFIISIKTIISRWFIFSIFIFIFFFFV